MKRLALSTICLSALTLLSACGEGKPTFSLLPQQDVFFQNSSALTNKLDILWVIDNSGSMQDNQNNVASNLNSFISQFVNNGYDFKIAVTTTEAYRAPYIGNPSLAQFRDGSSVAGHTGVRVITPSTPNLLNVFATNVLQGAAGSGDERALQSFREALNSPLNVGFHRPDAFLAIIIVSDEDDFAHDGTNFIDHNYNYAGLHPVQTYIDYLDNFTQSTGAMRRYSVSAITVADSVCLANQSNSSAVIGQRYIQLVQATDGIVGDICSPSFASSLNQIQTRIAELSTQFFLSRVPHPETIRVWVNYNSIPENATNGWTYNADANSIMFHGNAIPPQNAQIAIDFDPVTSR